MRRSLAGSLGRLGPASVTLLQLHNGITARRGEIAASLTPHEVLGRVLRGACSACGPTAWRASSG